RSCWELRATVRPREGRTVPMLREAFRAEVRPVECRRTPAAETLPFPAAAGRYPEVAVARAVARTPAREEPPGPMEAPAALRVRTRTIRPAPRNFPSTK